MSDKRLNSPARKFREIARLHGRAQRLAVAGSGGATRCTILTEVGRTSGVSLKELASRLRLDKGWVSRAVEKLVEEGAIARTPDPNDRRAVMLRLTPAGRRLHREIETALDEQIESVFRELAPSDRDRVGAALTKLLEVYAAFESRQPASEEDD